MRSIASTLTLASLLVAANASAESDVQPPANEWKLDPAHSRVGFSVTHMMISEVRGRFHEVSGKVLLDEQNPAKSSVELQIQTASIDTENADRDKHLKSADFLDAAKFPVITFKSTHISKAGKGWRVAGDLTLRGVTKPITLQVSLSQAMTSPWGQRVRAVKVEGKLDRLDYGASWNKTLDKGGVLVGNEVKLDIEVELNK